MSRLRRGDPAVFVLAFAAAWLGSGLSSGDDTYIYMTYARDLTETGRYAYNGTASSGATSLAWLLLGSVATLLFGASVWVWKLLSAACFALAFVFLARLLRPSSLWFWCLLLNPLTLRWSATGMENALSLLYLSGLILAWRSVAPARMAALLLAPLAVLIRPELTLLSGLLLLGHWRYWHRQRMAWLALALGTACVLAVLAILHAPLLPQTAQAKRILLAQADPLYATLAILRILLVSGLPLILLAVVLMLLREPRAAGLRRIWLPCALHLMVLGVYLAQADFLVSTRYETTLCFPALLASALVLEQQSGRWQRFARLAAGACLMISLALLVYFMPVKTVQEERALRAFGERAGQLVASQGGGAVALSEVGAFAYFSRLPVIDLFGLTSAHAQDFHRRHHLAPSRALELFLRESGAAYYVETFGGPLPLQGRALSFEPLLETRVVRNNMSTGRPVEDIWRLYKISDRGDRS